MKEARLLSSSIRGFLGGVLVASVVGCAGEDSPKKSSGGFVRKDRTLVFTDDILFGPEGQRVLRSALRPEDLVPVEEPIEIQWIPLERETTPVGDDQFRVVPFELSALETAKLWPPNEDWALVGLEWSAGRDQEIELALMDARYDREFVAWPVRIGPQPRRLVLGLRVVSAVGSLPGAAEVGFFELVERGMKVIARKDVPGWTCPTEQLRGHVGWGLADLRRSWTGDYEPGKALIEIISWNGSSTAFLAEAMLTDSLYSISLGEDEQRKVGDKPVSEWPDPVWLLMAEL